METMNYNRDNKKGSKSGIIGFMLFVTIGSAASFYMIANEPEPVVLGQDMYIPTTSTSTTDVNIYSEEELNKIEYVIKNNTSKTTAGKFKSNISVPEITIDGEVMEKINNEIFNKFATRYNSVKNEVKDLENTFTYKVTYNKYESNIGSKRVVSFTFYERIIDASSGTDVTYKLYGYTIDILNKKLLTQDEAAAEILGSTYKNIIKDEVKEFVILKKLYTDDTYSYTLTGFEEYYVKDKKLHIMFNPGEMGKNKDYLDIQINK